MDIRLKLVCLFHNVQQWQRACCSVPYIHRNVEYIKWSLGLDRCMPGYIVLAETIREKIPIKAGRRTTKFEEGIRTSTDRLVLKECL